MRFSVSICVPVRSPSARTCSTAKTAKRTSAKSYQIIRELNKELKSMGYHTIAGKCPIQFFKQKLDA